MLEEFLATHSRKNFLVCVNRFRNGVFIFSEVAVRSQTQE